MLYHYYHYAIYEGPNSAKETGKYELDSETSEGITSNSIMHNCKRSFIFICMIYKSSMGIIVLFDIALS